MRGLDNWRLTVKSVSKVGLSISSIGYTRTKTDLLIPSIKAPSICMVQVSAREPTHTYLSLPVLCDEILWDIIICLSRPSHTTWVPETHFCMYARISRLAPWTEPLLSLCGSYRTIRRLRPSHFSTLIDFWKVNTYHHLQQTGNCCMFPKEPWRLACSSRNSDNQGAALNAL